MHRAPVERVFEIFADFEAAPRWAGGVLDVRRTGRRTFRWAAETALDNLIEAYARAVAMTEGDVRYKPANDGLRADLERNYKFRHKNSTDGMQQLIDKYKKPAQ